MHSHLHMRQTLTCGFHKWTFFLCMLVQGMHDLFEDTPSPHIVYVWTNSDPGHAVTVQVPETFHRCSVYTRGHLSSRAP